MQFQSLLDPTRLIPIDSLGSVRGVASTGLVGCDHCPLDGKPKVMDAIEGRKIFVWTHAPGERGRACT